MKIFLVGLMVTGCTPKYDIFLDGIIGEMPLYNTSFVTIHSVGTTTYATSKVVYYDDEYYHIDLCKVMNDVQVIAEDNENCFYKFEYSEIGLTVEADIKSGGYTKRLDKIAKEFSGINDFSRYRDKDILFITSGGIKNVTGKKDGKIHFQYKIYDGSNIFIPLFKTQVGYSVPDVLIEDKMISINGIKKRGYVLFLDNNNSDKIVFEIPLSDDAVIKASGLVDGQVILVVTTFNDDIEKMQDIVYYVSPDNFQTSQIKFNNDEHVLNVTSQGILVMNNEGLIYSVDTNGENRNELGRLDASVLEQLISNYDVDFLDSFNHKHRNIINIHNIKGRTYIYIKEDLVEVIEFN